MRLHHFVLCAGALLSSIAGIARAGDMAFASQQKPQSKPSPTTPARTHVYLLIGQSNMAGRAKIEARDKGPIEGCQLLDKNGKWQPATNPLNRHSTIRKGLGMQRLGPGYAFAKRMRKAHPHTPIGLVVNARGGSKIGQWAKGTKHYNATLKRARTALAQPHTTLAGVVWHQGESDSQRNADYLKDLATLIKNLRADLATPKLPFVAGQVEQDSRDGKPPRPVNEAITKLPKTVRYTAVASTKGLRTTDGTHFDSASQRKLGERLAEAMLGLQKVRSPRQKSPVP